MGSIVEWERDLVEKTNRENQTAAYELSVRGLSEWIYLHTTAKHLMTPMFQKLFNIPSTFILMEGFRMYDKNGKEYNPSENEGPAT